MSLVWLQPVTFAACAPLSRPVFSVCNYSVTSQLRKHLLHTLLHAPTPLEAPAKMSSCKMIFFTTIQPTPVRSTPSYKSQQTIFQFQYSISLITCAAPTVARQPGKEVEKEVIFLTTWCNVSHLSTMGHTPLAEGRGGVVWSQRSQTSVLQQLPWGRLWYSPHRNTIWKMTRQRQRQPPAFSS